MPYKSVGKKVYTEKGGEWKLKQTCTSAENAQRAVRLLRGIKEGDWKPTGKPARR